MKDIKEANDAYNGMFPVNINKKSIPKLDLQTLQFSEEDMFRVYDISASKSLEILGNTLIAGLIEHENPAAPTEALHQVRVMFNRYGYDFHITTDRLSALKGMTEGYVDFPLFSRTNALYPYQIDQTYPGFRVEDDGIESKLGYKLVVRIHVTPTYYVKSTGEPVQVPSQRLEGEIIPQD